MERNHSWFRSNLTSMALALTLALTVWVVASLEQNPSVEDDLRTPIEIDVVGLEPGMVITNDYTRATTIRLRAQRETWYSLSPEDVTATADLSGLGPGIYQVELDIEVDAPATLEAANPDHIRIEIEELREREMPVQYMLEGQPFIGHTSSAPQLRPATVTVQGPRSRVDLISEVRATVSIEGLRDTFRSDVPLVAMDSTGSRVEGVTITPSSVNITIPIEQKTDYQQVLVIIRTVGEVAQGYYVSNILPTPQRITLQGDPDVIRTMEAYVTTEPIDLTGLTSDLRTQARLELPDGVVPIDTETVEVVVYVEPLISTLRLQGVLIQPEGLNEDLSVRLSPDSVDLILSGPQTLLESFNPSTDVVVTIDLTDLGPGTYQLEPDVAILRDDIAVESMFPIVVEVRIEPDTSEEGE